MLNYVPGPMFPPRGPPMGGPPCPPPMSMSLRGHRAGPPGKILPINSESSVCTYIYFTSSLLVYGRAIRRQKYTSTQKIAQISR